MLKPGDCGSWVVDAIKQCVYGHVVASDDFGEAYVVPLYISFQQMQSRLGADFVCLPNENDIKNWHERHTFKQPDRALAYTYPPNVSPLPEKIDHQSMDSTLIAPRSTAHAEEDTLSAMTAYHLNPFRDEGYVSLPTSRNHSSESPLVGPDDDFMDFQTGDGEFDFAFAQVGTQAESLGPFDSYDYASYSAMVNPTTSYDREGESSTKIQYPVSPPIDSGYSTLFNSFDPEGSSSATSHDAVSPPADSGYSTMDNTPDHSPRPPKPPSFEPHPLDASEKPLPLPTNQRRLKALDEILRLMNKHGESKSS